MLDELDERITDVKDQKNWQQRLRGFYQITSGNTFDMQIKLLHDDNTVFIDDRTTAKITFYPHLDIPAAVNDTDKINEEEYYANRTLKSNIVKCSQGEYKFRNVEVQLMPGTLSLLEIEFGFFDEYQTLEEHQFIPFLEKRTALIAIEARLCVLGEYYSKDHICRQCADNTNTYTPRTIE